MHRTPFAGLTELDPGDPITIDGASFTRRNPSAIDHFLKVGALTHRHDGHPGLPNPVSAVGNASAMAASGGQISAGIALYVAYTLTDVDGGETARSTAVTVTTPSGPNVPSAAITAEFDPTGGGLPVGQFTYALTLNDSGGGESVLGPSVFVQRPYGYTSGQIVLTGLSQEIDRTDPLGWQSYNVWRMQDGSSFELIGAVETGDTFIDDGLICTDASRQPPSTMGAVAANSTLLFSLPRAADDPALASAAQVNIYVSQDGSFEDGCYAFSYPATASGGAAVQMFDLVLQASAPPVITRAIGGANLINPDTDMLDWNWKRPVATPAGLPGTGNASGDTRVSLAPLAIFVWDAALESWGVVAAASGVGGGGGGSVVASAGTASASVGFIGFSASGGASVQLMQSGASAVIMIGAASGGGGGGGGVSTPIVASAGNASATVGPFIGFAASGGATVQLTQSGASATVVISASGTQGPQGDIGTPGASGAPGPSGTMGPLAASQFSGSGYTMVLADANTVIESTGSSPQTLYVPASAAVNYPDGTVLEGFQYGTGALTASGSTAAVVLLSDGGRRKVNAQYGTIGFRKRHGDEWVLSGDLT